MHSPKVAENIQHSVVIQVRVERVEHPAERPHARYAVAVPEACAAPLLQYEKINAKVMKKYRQNELIYTTGAIGAIKSHFIAAKFRSKKEA